MWVAILGSLHAFSQLFQDLRAEGARLSTGTGSEGQEFSIVQEQPLPLAWSSGVHSVPRLSSQCFLLCSGVGSQNLLFTSTPPSLLSTLDTPVTACRTVALRTSPY